MIGKFYEICKKYIQLRPKCFRSDRFFLHYRKGEYWAKGVPIGISTFRSVPKEIARFLNLRNAEDYAGNAFSCSFENLLIELGTLPQYKEGSPSSVSENNRENPLLSIKIIRNHISSTSTEKLASTVTRDSLQPAPHPTKSGPDQLPSTSTSAVNPTTSIPTELQVSNASNG